jgi:hypothetical protein
MNTRIASTLAVFFFILLLGITIFIFSTRDQERLQVFPATINRDCAPWDGSAFTLSIPIEDVGITISIYRSPDIRFPVTFLFPDDTMREGNAFLLSRAGLPEQLAGKVTFESVQQGKTVEGFLDLVTDSSQHFRGRFTAEWGDQLVMCG